MHARVTFVLLILFMGLLPVRVAAFFGRTVIIPRSETVNSARSLAGWQEHINDFDVGRTYGSFYLAPEYKRSFNNNQLVDFLLGGKRCFAVQGSRVPNRSRKALLADYFGLPQDFSSIVCFDPQITNFIFDMNFYLGLDGLCEGLYLRFHAPVVHSKWDLNLCECVDMKGTYTYPAGYMAAKEVQRDVLPESFNQAISGRTCNVCKSEEPLTFGDMQDPLTFGRIQGRRNLSRLSDVHFTVGYNFFNSDDYHLGLNARISFPAGNRPNPDFFFAPIIGNGHHWELGVGYTSHILFWSGKDALDFAGFWLDANVTHLFADEQCRSYDFCNNPGSRYMLLSKIVPVQDAEVQVNGMPIDQQYQQRLFPAVNLTTLKSKISMKAQVDLVAKCCLQKDGIQYDIGYNLWYRSPETLESRCPLNNCLAFKGDAQLFGFVSQTQGDLMVNQPLPLNVTQSEATVRSGQGAGNFVAGAEFANENADNPAAANDANGNPLNQLNDADAAYLMIAQQQVNASDGPILITDEQIDPCSTLNPKALSHKLFGNIGYTWEHPNVGMAPFLNLGTEIEWRCTNCNDNSAISQWGIWAKGGLSF